MNSSSFIDYFALSENFGSADMEILDWEPNHSDHLPILISVPRDKCCVENISSKYAKRECNNNNYVRQLRWDHADLLLYHSSTYTRLCPIYERIDALYRTVIGDTSRCDINICDSLRADCISAIDSIYMDIVAILSNTAASCVPSVPKNFFKFWWDQEIDALKQSAIAAHREWVKQGRPKQGPIFQERQKSKFLYKNTIKSRKTS
jgi:hypothetical protein